MQETGKWSYKINKLEGGNKIKKKKIKKWTSTMNSKNAIVLFFKSWIQIALFHINEECE